MLSRLDALRVNEGMNLEDVSDLTGFSKAKISRIENGDTDIKLKDALILCDIFHVDNPRDINWYPKKK